MSELPQLLLAMPPEVIRLLTGILSCLQRLEGEARDIRVRLGAPAPRTAESNVRAAIFTPAGISPENIPRPQTRPLRKSGSRAVHTKAGPGAQARLRKLRERHDWTQSNLSEKLGVTGGMIAQIESGKCGISIRVHEAIRKLEATDGGRP